MKPFLTTLCATVTALAAHAAAAAQDDAWTPDSWQELATQAGNHSRETGHPLVEFLIRPEHFEEDLEIGSAFYLDRASLEDAFDLAAFTPVTQGTIHRVFFKDQGWQRTFRRRDTTYQADCENRRVKVVAESFYRDVAGEDLDSESPSHRFMSETLESGAPGSELDIAVRAICDGRTLYDPAQQ